MQAGLVAPEAMILTTPNMIRMLNGLVSLVDHGLMSCSKGFGDLAYQNARECREQPYAHLYKVGQEGALQFTPAAQPVEWGANFCKTGIREGNVCCNGKCGECGGGWWSTACNSRPGGAGKCCDDKRFAGKNKR